jgi:hypothetical protein
MLYKRKGKKTGGIIYKHTVKVESRNQMATEMNMFTAARGLFQGRSLKELGNLRGS